MSGHRSALVSALAIGLRVATLDAAPAKQVDTPRLAVILNDYAGAQPDVLARAKSHVTVIYSVAGVEVEWIDRDDPRLAERDFLNSVVTVSLYSDEMANRAADPEAVVGKAAPGGRTAKVMYDRIAGIGRGRSADSSFLLGNVIAHEIGHLVLPGRAHSPVGLMVPQMTISVAISRPLFFTLQQSKIIRSALVRLRSADNAPQHVN